MFANRYLYLNDVIFIQREEKEDYAAEAQFVDEHGKVLARKVSHIFIISYSHTNTVNASRQHFTVNQSRSLAQRVGNSQQSPAKCWLKAYCPHQQI